MATVTIAENLLGVGLQNGWRVAEKKQPEAGGPDGERRSIGQFSCCYVVTRGTERAFLKAIDMSRILQGADAIELLLAALNQYQFEKNILEHCLNRKMDRIVRILDAGVYLPPGGNEYERVPYIIFELADRDARQIVKPDEIRSVAWALHVLHNVAVGLSQLHASGVAHQDVKLSNVFDFGNLNIKLGDLGRAVPKLTALASICPHLESALAGDPAYAPPELLYDAPPGAWEKHRFGADVYLLGNLIVALFLGASLTAQIQDRLAPEHRAYGFVVGDCWGGSYADVLPYLRHSFESVMLELAEYLHAANPRIAPDLALLARQLCEPDPERRGDPRNIARGRGFDLERIVSRLAHLAKLAEIESRTSGGRA